MIPVLTTPSCFSLRLPMKNAAVAAPSRELLGQWGLEAHRVVPIEAKGNTHWKLEGARDNFILRRYRAGQTATSIEYEFKVLRHLHSLGWPVAPPITDIVSHNGAAFALFPFLPGQQPQHEDQPGRRARERILAHLHRDLHDIHLSQRDGWRRADEVVLDDSTEGTWLRARPSNGTALANILSSQCARIRNRFRAAGTDRLPCTTVHGDFIGQNLLFAEGTLTGVLDFDSVHFDLRAADVACARRRADDELVRGYLEVSPLEEIERQCLDDLWRASVLRYAFQLRDGVTAHSLSERELRWCVRQLDETTAFTG